MLLLCAAFCVIALPSPLSRRRGFIENDVFSLDIGHAMTPLRRSHTVCIDAVHLENILGSRFSPFSGQHSLVLASLWLPAA